MRRLAQEVRSNTVYYGKYMKWCMMVYIDVWGMWKLISHYFKFAATPARLCPNSSFSCRVSGDLSKLPEGRPGYSHELPQTPDSQRSPWSHLESPGAPQPGVRHKFYSQSIVTIRRPDGVSIKLTKTCSLGHRCFDSGSLFKDYLWFLRKLWIG